MSEKCPTVVFLIGLPGCGKSTIVKKNYANFVHVSSDEFIDKRSSSLGKTYNDVFFSTIKSASKYAMETFKDAISKRENIVVDRTNLSYSSRANYLLSVPDHYYRIAHVVSCEDEIEWRNRLSGRPGKTIPETAIQSMINQYETPTKEEGFDLIFEVDTSRRINNEYCS